MNFFAHQQSLEDTRDEFGMEPAIFEELLLLAQDQDRLYQEACTSLEHAAGGLLEAYRAVQSGESPLTVLEATNEGARAHALWQYLAGLSRGAGNVLQSKFDARVRAFYDEALARHRKGGIK